MSPETPVAPHRSLPQVPYFSQWESADLVPALLAGTVSAAADPRWPASGAESAEEYDFWSWRACGVACLRMVLSHRGTSPPPSLVLVRECVAAGAYVQRDAQRVDGLLYEPFVRYVRRRWALPAEVAAPLPLADLTRRVRTGALVMASVHPSIRSLAPEPPARGGHLVLVMDVTPAGDLVLHNPSGLPDRSQRFAVVGPDDFGRFYAERGVVLPPP
ncbi:hypothetical protein [Jidongwangia harbinensis]|uniref:hypothetical protein n=1 Tax=Jidongwangia harbinensis TaxID=2878561 RepID=UPI001CD9AE16|nr:hypothetical protein [Jidongwangia harbinensis]MCA2211414.1 hypothetical protein [Jidongwangia harbinensis]